VGGSSIVLRSRWWLPGLCDERVVSATRRRGLPSHSRELRGEAMVRDPVCMMQVDERTAKAKSDYKDKTYYFCSLDCKEQFDNNPERYTKAA
jgi:YHS domain-containing protein